MWVFCGDPPAAPVRWFEYDPSRASEVPLRVLFPDAARAPSNADPPEAKPLAADPPGADPPLAFYLQSDGYSAYHVVAAAAGVIAHAGCWAHVRRKFVEAASGRNAGAAQQMVALIGALYAVERSLRGEDPETRVRGRAARSRPILMRIRQ